MKRTPWFLASAPPSRPGFYETVLGDNPTVYKMRFWDEKGWRLDGPNGRRSIFGTLCSDRWRGLAEPAK